MKKITFYTFLLLAFISCESTSECFESTGEIVTKEVIVNPFTKILVNRGISLIITDGPVHRVVIQTGENLIDNIEMIQRGDQLVFEDKTTCNWVRDFGQAVIHITSPNITEVYSKTEKIISSNGVLTYPDITITSFDKNADGIDGAGTGDFYLAVACTNLNINSNNVSRFFLQGTVSNYANLNFFAGDSRIEAPFLIAQNINVFHRGSNDMIIHPVQLLSGELNSTGNVRLANIPIQLNIQQLNAGQVLFN